MKLRNKKTGEICEVLTDSIAVNVLIDSHDMTGYYTSLAELNAEWEDYEEPKEYWAIDCFSTDGDIVSQFTGCSDTILENRKSIGNYFETREEAEKAVEKLKAWKRLKDAGFKFTDWHRDICEVAIDAEIYDEGNMEMIKDLNLLFGGEE